MVELCGICWDWVGYAGIGWDGCVLSGVGIYFFFLLITHSLIIDFFYIFIPKCSTARLVIPLQKIILLNFKKKIRIAAIL